MFQKKQQTNEVKFEKKDRTKAKVKEPREGRVGIGTILIPFIIAGIIVLLIYLAINAGASSGDKIKVYVAKEDISANTYIVDFEDYFDDVMIDSSVVPKSAVQGDFPSKFYVFNKLNKNQMVLEDDLVTSNTRVEGIDNTTDVTGISVKDHENAVGGTLRSGDLIDIYAMNPDTDQLELMVEDILIKDALDSTGKIILDEGVAESFNIYVPLDKQEAINKALSFGDIQLYLAQ